MQTGQTGKLPASTYPWPFVQPDRALALAWTPGDEDPRQRWILAEAILPTFRKWARALTGRAPDPRWGEVVYDNVAAMRDFLTRDLTRERPGHIVSRGMLAYCWWRELGDGERAVLQTFAEQGEGVARRQHNVNGVVHQAALTA